jgi:hypothetical protein
MRAYWPGGAVEFELAAMQQPVPLPWFALGRGRTGERCAAFG